MVVGAKNDPAWEPIVLAGFGSITPEILHPRSESAVALGALMPVTERIA